jgi:very-short-patch-repair endonuclease
LKLTGPESTKKRARQLRQTMSKPERLLWWALRNNQLGPHIRKQHPAGRYVLDFYCDSAKLCIEVDGQAHDLSVARDEVRDRWLTSQGVKTVRIPAREVVENLDGVVSYISELVRAPSDPLRGPPPPEGEGLKRG